MLHTSAFGLGSVAASWLLKRDGLLAEEAGEPFKPDLEQKTYDLLPKQPHHEPQAKAMISMFMLGGPSQIDLFDPKPELIKHDGKTFPGDVKFDNPAQASREIMAPLWKFKPHGQCGMELSELVPHLGEIADEITLIRSMHTGANNHIPSNYALSTGRATSGRAVLGSWLTSALGSEPQDLPAYGGMPDPAGHPVDGVRNWSNGWLPPLFQGTVVRSRQPRILNLQPPKHLVGELQQKNLTFLAALNRRHLERHRGEADLEARIASYELAARMQTSAREALDISQETRATQDLYGIHDNPTREYGTRCLIARRLIERGVRFVQLFLNYQPWDNHSNIRASLPSICRKTDKPSAGLVKDLKQRGLLDQTIVHWGGEIGRLPVIENHGDIKKCGRDHNGQGFSTWFAGGGFKAGIAYGQTDEFGHRSVVDKVSPHDYQATLLHLFGIDHKQLKYLYNAQDQMLTDHKDCRVVRDILV